ncbi:hypothetical protein KAR91_56085 [Candidatus Pacearchaeota archaeon]|nr:hypothetical protein [Candidatus Pacearchaeota archaeon]
MPDEIPIVEAEKAIQFECGHCEHINFESDSLDSDWINDAACRSDVIACSKCGKDNKVVERS